VRLYRGPLRTVHFALRIPRDVSPGAHLIRIVGASADDATVPSAALLSLVLSLFGDLQRSSGADSMAELIGRFESGAGYDGVRAVLAGNAMRVFRSRAVRIDGRTIVPFVVVRPKHRGKQPPAIGRILGARG